MHVTRILHPTPTSSIEVPGQLLRRSGNGPVVFVPDGDPYGPYRLTIHDPTFGFYGAEDDHCISVSGLVEVERTPMGEQLWRKVVMESFYPAPIPTPAH